MSIYDLQGSKQAYLNQFYQTLLSLLNSGSSSSGDIPLPRLNLIGLTKLKIDELMPQAEGLQFSVDGVDTSNIVDLYINAILDEAVKHALQVAPLHILVPSEGGTLPVEFEVNSEIGTIILPDNYLRFVCLKIATWLQELDQVLPTSHPDYKLQKYTHTRGGIAKPKAFISSKVKVNVPVKQVDTVTLYGASGTAKLVGPGGLNKDLTYVASLTQTATNFVTANAAAYLLKGIVLTSSGADLIFTASVAGVPFEHPAVITTSGDLAGMVVATTSNVPAREAKRIIEYYSDPTKVHSLSKFLYIEDVGAEYVQTDLYPAITWLCAAKLLQIWGQFSGNASYAERAMQQMELSFQNLL